MQAELAHTCKQNTPPHLILYSGCSTDISVEDQPLHCKNRHMGTLLLVEPI